MGLKHFLYRCPFCGHDPLEGKGRAAHCSACGRRYGPGRDRGSFKVCESGQEVFEVAGHELARRIEALGGPLTRAKGTDGGFTFRSAVTVRFARDEQPLRSGDALLGFIEQYGQPLRGTLELDSDRLCFRPPRGPGWASHLIDLASLQASSSSVQMSLRDGGVVSCRFHGESAYRWERLLKRRLQEVWTDAGRGTIVEFQPRLRSG